MMKLALFTLLALLASARLQLASAQACSTYLTEATCYAQRATCHYDPLTSACVTGTPNKVTCSDYWRDTTGCALTASAQVCAINPWNNICYKPIPACSTITGSDANCVARSDCKVLVSGSTCQTNPTGTCFAQSASPTGCLPSVGCYFDSYAPVASRATCTASLGEVITNYPNCGLWSYYPAPSSQPCDAHGCSYNAVTGVCGVQTADGGATPSTVSLVSDFTISSIVVDPLTLIMTGIVSIPVGQYFKPGSPRYHALVLGDANVTPGVPLAPGVCNSLLTGQSHPAFYVGLPKVNPSYADAVDLYSKFSNAVTTGPTANTLVFTTGLTSVGGVPADLAIYQTIGYNRVSKTDTSSILKTAAINGATSSVDLAFSVSLQGGVANCGWTTTVVPSSYTQYSAKMTLYVREGDNVMTSSIIETVTVYSYGLVQTGATTANAVTYSLDPTVDSAAATAFSAACPVGQKRRLSTIREVWTNPNTATLVGLRDVNDASMVASGQTQPVGALLTNCFGTRIVAVTPPASCPSKLCTTLVQRESRCATMLAHPNGDALNLCQYQTAANRIADMGADVAYPAAIPPVVGTSSLDRVQNYYHYPREWTAGNPAGAIYVGSDSTGVTPDMVAVSLSAKSYADQLTNTYLVVDCGFLPTPNSPISSAIIVASITSATSTFAYNIRNIQLSNSGSMAIACWMRDVAQRSTYTVTLDTTSGASQFFIKPLDAQGVIPTYAYSALTWDANIKPVLTHSPRYMTVGGAVPPHMTLTNTLSGFDGFALPAYWISQQLPSVGYVLRFGVSVSIPSAAGSTVSNVVSRRLLQVDLGSNSTLLNENRDIAFGISNVTNSHMLSSALGSSKSSTAVSFAVGGAIAAATAMALVVAYMTTATTVVIEATSAVGGKFKSGRI